ncbi:MAG: hypothetical protein K0S36_473 [Nitrosospira multiformis]|nr:hypothetical protein [Nitrosospira multiformis]
MHSTKMIAGATFATAILCSPSAWSAAPVVYSGSGANAATALDAFRAAIGGDRNAAGPQADGRREINWVESGWMAQTRIRTRKWLTAGIQLSFPSIASRTREHYSRTHTQ